MTPPDGRPGRPEGPVRPGRIFLAVAPAVVLVVVALWELAATLVISSHAADAGDDDWARAAAAVRAQHQPGDLVVFAPRWVDPVGRHHLGDLIPLEHAGRMDSARFARIWEVSVRGASAAEARGTRTTSSVSYGKVRVRLLEQPPAKVLTDFVARVADARSEQGSPIAILEEVGFEPHRCIRITPPAGGAARVIFPTAQLGTRLVGHVGLADVFTRREIREPIRLEVKLGGAVVAAADAGVDSGWVRFEAVTPPGTAEVVFEVQAPSPRAHNRLACFAAEARE